MIVSKLSTYRRQNRTNKALWEFDNITKSLYLLDYVDLPMRRSNVHKALNRYEACYRLYFNARVHRRWRAQPIAGFVTVQRLVDITPTHRQVDVVEQVKALSDIV
ncbi:MAG: hypothetical protein DBP01_15315, partial [gamma proteobacterium symbiont of Ctena orbiculata]